MLSSSPEMTLPATYLRDESHADVLRVRGLDTLDLLHRLSTSALASLRVGEARETLLTTEKGRVIDAVVVLPSDSGARLLCSAGRGTAVQQWLEKFTIMEDCEYTLVSALYGQFAVYGTLPALPFDVPDEGQLRTVDIGGVPVDVLRLSRVTGASLLLLCRRDESGRMLDALSSHGIPVIAEEDFLRWRVRNLLPAVGNELGELSNPLEAGAGAVVDFHKGCYIGQEVIARLDSYDKVQRQLVRLRWHAALPAESLPGQQLLDDARDAGFVTTQVSEADGSSQIGIGCVRKTWASPGTVLHCLVDGETVEITVE